MAILGAIVGSFAGAQVWRLRARQLVEDKARGEKVAAAELKRLKPLITSMRHDRSRCLSCRHELAWYDLIPVLSWVWLRGKCRYCQEFIGWPEVLLEVGLAAVFAISAWLWQDWSLVGAVQFGLYLVALGMLAMLFVYDARWFLLPDVIMWPLVAVAAVYAGISLMQSSDMVAALWSLGGAAIILSGLYGALYVISRGAWIGFGDVKLGLALALLLGQWPLAFMALFAANLIGTALVVPGMLTGALQRNAKIPFGPLLIVGFLLVQWWGHAMIQWIGILP
ncbi:MAG: prepilin peptidase [Candidatus Saccharibacteria bacterium]|nr:prepilin peptidase [Candidatus Saccharibacteria bacterium]